VSGITVTAVAAIPPEQVEAARDRLASLLARAGVDRGTTQLTLRRGDPGDARPYVADVIAFHQGAVLAAHAVGATPVEAAEAVADRLGRQLERMAGSDSVADE
jgi:ribosome-associated translation inhibitor RaiA